MVSIDVKAISKSIACKNKLKKLVETENKGIIGNWIEEYPLTLQDYINKYSLNATIKGIKEIYSKKKQPTLAEIEESIKEMRNKKTF